MRIRLQALSSHLISSFVKLIIYTGQRLEIYFWKLFINVLCFKNTYLKNKDIVLLARRSAKINHFGVNIFVLENIYGV